MPITRFPGLEVDPAISPDGNLVAFAWEGGGGDNFDIYVRSIDGALQLPLTKDAAADHAPAWSPDGQRIAFVRVLEGKREIVVLPVLGGPEQLLFEAAPELGGWMWWGGSYGLSWTPDGKHLVFGDRSGPASNSAIYLYSFEDGERRQLTRPPANLSDIHPVVSPNGRYLAFVRVNPERRRPQRLSAEARAAARGRGNRRQLTSGLRVIGFDWAPDSRNVIHDSGNREPGLWRAAVAGGAPEPVLPNIRAIRPSVARSGAGVVYQNMLHRREHLGTAHAVLPESRTLRRRDFSRHRVDGSRHGYAVLTGWNTDRVRLGKVGPQRDMGVEPRRISGEQTDKLRGRRAGGKPCLECRRQADRVRRS